jgi:hypothetical protein
LRCLCLPGSLAAVSPPFPHAAYASFADNNAFVFGNDIYVDDPSEWPVVVCLVAVLVVLPVLMIMVVVVMKKGTGSVEGDGGLLQRHPLWHRLEGKR